jgi:predicted site-specific integrase-resolvase
MPETHIPRSWKSHRGKAEQLDVSTKTLDRWVARGLIEPPLRINGRKYHKADSRPRRDGATPEES